MQKEHNSQLHHKKVRYKWFKCMCMFFIQCCMQLLRCFHVSDTNQEENGSPLMACVPSLEPFRALRERTGQGWDSEEHSVGEQGEKDWHENSLTVFAYRVRLRCRVWARAFSYGQVITTALGKRGVLSMPAGRKPAKAQGERKVEVELLIREGISWPSARILYYL